MRWKYFSYWLGIDYIIQLYTNLYIEYLHYAWSYITQLCLNDLFIELLN